MSSVLDVIPKLYRFGVFARYLVMDWFSSRKPGHRCDYYFFVNGMHFQENTEFGLEVGKAEYWLRLLDIQGTRGLLVINPFRVRPTQKTTRKYLTLEPLAIRILLRLFFTSKREWVIERCDPEGFLKRNLFNKLTVETYFNFLSRNPTVLILGIGLTPELCLVAKYIGVTTLEFQHGSTNKGSFSTIGTCMWTPDYEYVWDKHYLAGVENRNNLIPIGYPRKFPNMSPTQPLTETGRPKNVLVSLSYGDAGSIDPAGVMNTIVYEAISVLVAEKFNVTIRPHPASTIGLEVSLQDKIYRRKFVPWFKNDYVLQQTILDEDRPIFESISGSDFHLTFSSSLVVEAAYMGIPSFLLCKEGEVDDYLASLIQYGIAKLSTPSNLLRDFSATNFPGPYPNTLDEQLFLQTFNYFLHVK